MTDQLEQYTGVSMAPPLLLDTRQTAAVLGIGRTHFYRLCASGRIGPLPVKLGERSLWARAELEDWVAAGCPVREDWLRQKQPGRH
jgi:excisionase family DNA binding protein